MKNKGPLAAHILFWTLILSVLLWDTFSGNQKPTLYEAAVRFGYFAVINLSIFYINYTLLIPILVKQKKKYGLYMVSIVMLIAVMVIIKTVVASFNGDFFLSYLNRDTGQI